MRRWLLICAALGLAGALLAPLFSETTTGYASPLAATSKGYAYFYSPGMFQTVARNRGIKLRSDVDGYAAVPNCRYIGQVVKARINGHETERYQVLDCSAPSDRARHVREGLVIEIDYQSAVRNEFSRRGRAPANVYYP
jgi:hypothetical protein